MQFRSGRVAKTSKALRPFEIKYEKYDLVICDEFYTSRLQEVWNTNYSQLVAAIDKVVDKQVALYRK